MRIRQIIVLLIIASLFAVTACASPASSPTPTQKTLTPTPIIIEKDVEIKYSVKEREGLPFYLKVGDRVEGEVSIDEGVFYGDRYIDRRAFIGSVGSRVKDPYGNIVVRAEHGFPWKFAFIAYTYGEYELEVYFTAQVQQIQPSAHLKITRYEGELSPTSQFK